MLAGNCGTLQQLEIYSLYQIIFKMKSILKQKIIFHFIGGQADLSFNTILLERKMHEYFRVL